MARNQIAITFCLQNCRSLSLSVSLTGQLRTSTNTHTFARERNMLALIFLAYEGS